MKKCNVFKGTLVLLTTVTLLSGCNKTEEEKKSEIEASEVTTEEEKKSEIEASEATTEKCEHLIVDFGNQTVIFKECEGYDISCISRLDSGLAKYTITDGNEVLLSGYTTEFNDYYTSHNTMNEIEQKAIDKGAYVYKLQK